MVFMAWTDTSILLRLNLDFNIIKGEKRMVNKQRK